MLTVTIICALGTATVALPAEVRVTEPVRAAFCAHAHEYGAGFPGDDLWRAMMDEVERELRG